MHHPPAHGKRAAYRVAEVADMIGLSTSQVYAMVSRGEIGHVKSGRSVVIPVAALDAWLATAQQATA